MNSSDEIKIGYVVTTPASVGLRMLFGLGAQQIFATPRQAKEGASYRGLKEGEYVIYEVIAQKVKGEHDE